MKHAGNARRAGLKLIAWSFLLAVLVTGAWSFLAGRVLTAPALVLAGVWFLFLLFCISFFRDPEANVPAEVRAVVAPGHGTVDVIDETTEKVFMGGRCKRLSIFLSVFDVHVQNAPVAGRVSYVKHSPGQFLNAMRTDCGTYNENVLIGFGTGPGSEERVAVRLIAGLIARRIVPWVVEGDSVAKGERISLIQFGSRVDLYLPMNAEIQVRLGQKVRGGETVVGLYG